MKINVKNSTFRWGIYRHLARCSVVAGCLVIALTMASPTSATAQTRSAPEERFVSSESFWVMCTSNWGHVAYLEMYAACRAYVAGVADVLADGQAVGNIRACFDQEATKGRVTEAVIAWMKAHPERKQLTAVQITATALAQKYPCS